MHADDELRAELVRDRANRDQPRTAGAVLSDLRPAMRRARRRRTAATTAAITVALVGLAGAAQVVRTDRSDTISITSDDTLTAPDPERPTPTEPDEQTPDRSPVDSTIAAATDGHRIGSDGNEPVEPPVASPDGEPSDDDHHADAAQRPDDDDSLTPQTGRPPTAPSTTVPAAPPTAAKTVTTTLPTPKAERFDSPCGYAMAIRSADSIDVVDVVPANGYDYRLEDRDHGDVSVQFTGNGEDCELKITTTGSTSGTD